MKILIVEDDNMIREGISEYLLEFGYTVIQAKDGIEALSKFNNYKFGYLRYSDTFYKWFRSVEKKLERKAIYQF